jgi:hypothetical protein
MNDARLLNVTAIKEHALRCSKETRAGKFDRVGADFLDGVETDIESVIRALVNSAPLADGFAPVEKGSACFVTGAMADKLAAAMNLVVARIIQKRVHRHPSLGKTLQG